MTPAAGRPTFSVISGAQVRTVLDGTAKDLIDLVERTYRTHAAGGTVNPDSYFLRFPDRPAERIIALPASVGGDVDVHGIKWISSFPGNVADGLPRASAVVILNDTRTGYPFACLESSIISASRTAASAALAAAAIADRRGPRPTRVGYVGTGLIARYVHTYLRAAGFSFEEIGLHDKQPAAHEGFAGFLRRTGDSAVRQYESSEDLLRASDLIVFATVAGEPHVHDRALFDHAPLVLHLSLRDLAPAVIRGAVNVVDDVEHCLKAGTSLHLTQEQDGNRDFVAGTLVEVLDGVVEPVASRPVIFSPFGLGVLDLAVARFVYDRIAAAGELTAVPDFFVELSRHG
ncbi:2,3-diaminopropionate biosynthesis protein SbnB [Actinoplanes auranticolor]|uniref:2,3-diaminopropionate biosynthesis protein SbnB n=1 Tax=Actinoplanes auranticolor TaxID=47988 RepID=A0A919SXI2_9ACTN|nr:2,3-diaminopropionate biosynthesis protein SbnB [Actinoplanes auranticolor]GIM80165.1 2,3-diaminopropionate biosynthesis protein SbnB [Actinoplanes auranticolor]